MMAMMVSVGKNGEPVAMRHCKTGGNKNVMDEHVRKLNRCILVPLDAALPHHDQSEAC